MRLLTIVCDLLPGGTQRVARNFALGYHHHGFESAVLALGGGGALERSFPEGSVELFLGGTDACARQAALRAALAWQPDVVHLHREGPADSVTGEVLRAMRGSPRRGTTARVGVMETNVFARVDYSADRQCIDVHMQLSRWCLWKWRRWSSFLDPRPIGVLVPNLVMHRDFAGRSARAREEFRRRYGIPQDALVFGRVGSPVESKWSPVAVRAFSTFAHGHSHAWLLTVGMPPGLRSVLESLPDGVRKRIVTIDFLSDDEALRDAYAAMDVFLHASRIGESFGMVLAEALLSGIPIITLSTPTKDNSQLEVVGHERGGLVVTDAAGMLEAMRRLESKALRHQYALQGAAAIAERFGPEVVMPRAIEIAELTALGLERPELGRRLSSLPHLCPEVSTAEVSAQMRRCIGRYRLTTVALMHLVANPFVYRAYRSVAARS